MREKPEGIVNSQGGSKVMLPPALIILHKNEESRSGSISFGNLHPSPDSSFLLLSESLTSEIQWCKTGRKTATARLEEFTYYKIFRLRFLFSVDYSMTSFVDKAENRPCFKNFSAEREDVGGRLRMEVRKSPCPEPLVFLSSRSGVRTHPPSSQNTF